MADQEEQTELTPEEEEDDEYWDNDTTGVPEHYIKVSRVDSDLSDVTLLLGNGYRKGGSFVLLCKMRLIMTHRDFLDFAEDVRREAAFLTKIYKGKRPGPNPTDEEYERAMKEAYGID